jgi:hypothetical protein
MANWHEPRGVGGRTTVTSGAELRREAMHFNLEIAVACYLTDELVRENGHLTHCALQE